VNNRVRMEGFIVFDYLKQYEAGRAQLASWIEAGQLTPKWTEFEGLANAPAAFIELLGGGTVGTTVVRVAD
jgi:NADPH-dependent curcumin reductase CurA